MLGSTIAHTVGDRYKVSLVSARVHWVSQFSPRLLTVFLTISCDSEDPGGSFLRSVSLDRSPTVRCANFRPLPIGIARDHVGSILVYWLENGYIRKFLGSLGIDPRDRWQSKARGGTYTLFMFNSWPCWGVGEWRYKPVLRFFTNAVLSMREIRHDMCAGATP